jgi:hypothetical protein
MSWSFSNPRSDPSLLLTPEHPNSITTSTLEEAAKAAGTDIPGVVANLVRSLAIWTAGQSASDQPVVKGSDDEYAAMNVIKAADERRYTLGVAYPAMRVDVAVAADGHRDYTNAATLETAAWSWMSKSRTVGLYHRKDSSPEATVVESYIWRADPWVTKAVDGSEQTVHPGDWLLGVVWNEETWPLVKKGLVNGFSPQGSAKRGIPTAESLALLRG